MKFLEKRQPEGAPGRVAKPAATTAITTTRDRGNAAEDQALAHLQVAGLQLVVRNYRTPGRGGGEIDLVMRERDGTLVFVEVRSRAGSAFGGAGASISAHQAAAHHFCRPALFAAPAFAAPLPF